MKEHRIMLPLYNENILNEINVGEKIYFSGELFVFRDQVHKKIVNNEVQQISHINFSNSAVYYCASTPKKNNLPVGSCGPTSSYRMDEYTDKILMLGFKVMIGKGLRSQKVVDLCKKYKAIYCITYGGCGAYLSKFVLQTELIAYPELDTEAMYKFKVLNFPCIVAIDILGRKIW